MKISKKTIKILENFATIEPTLKITQGSNEVITVNQKSGSFMARAVLEETFPEEVRIFELQRFLPILSLFENPEFSFTDKYVEITEDGRGTIRYFYFDPSISIRYPKTLSPLTEPDIAFKLTADVLKRVKTSSNIIGLPHITISGNGETVFLATKDVSKKELSNKFEIPVGKTDNRFEFVYPKERFLLIDDDYDVGCSKDKAVCYLKATNYDLEYWIAGNKGLSSFE